MMYSDELKRELEWDGGHYENEIRKGEVHKGFGPMNMNLVLVGYDIYGMYDGCIPLTPRIKQWIYGAYRSAGYDV